MMTSIAKVTINPSLAYYMKCKIEHTTKAAIATAGVVTIALRRTHTFRLLFWIVGLFLEISFNFTNNDENNKLEIKDENEKKTITPTIRK